VGKLNRAADSGRHDGDQAALADYLKLVSAHKSVNCDKGIEQTDDLGVERRPTMKESCSGQD
jgi:hypothetical protein